MKVSLYVYMPLMVVGLKLTQSQYQNLKDRVDLSYPGTFILFDSYPQTDIDGKIYWGHEVEGGDFEALSQLKICHSDFPHVPGYIITFLKDIDNHYETGGLCYWITEN